MPDFYCKDMASDPDDGAGLLDANLFSFMRRELIRDISSPDLDVVVTGVPFDLATTHRPGARLAPASIRKVSENLFWETRRWPWDFCVFDILGVGDCGDLLFDTGDVDHMIAQLQRHACRILDAGKTMLTFGGDHYITLPLLREHAKKFGPLSLIHFDAHADTEKEARERHHGTMFGSAVKEGIIAPDRSVQVGIRTEYDMTPDYRFTVLDAAWVNEHRAGDISAEIKRVVGDHPAYITFDIDCLDPAFAPGTGTPVIGGLTTDMA
ncbi:MAG: agmatinase, partial [Desulfobacterales bacterium]|nr:agmatinase [Desulfobacterales bacterium]